MTPHTLFTLALQADARYTAACAPKTRWTADHTDPAIAAAYRAKVDADAVWLTYMRSNA